MPYVLRKAPRRELYWVVNTETGEKYSHDPIPKRRAEAQRRALYLHTREGKGKHSDLAQLVMRKNAKGVLADLIDKDREAARQERRALERSGDVSDRPRIADLADYERKLRKDIRAVEADKKDILGAIGKTMNPPFKPYKHKEKEPRGSSPLAKGKGKDCGCGGGENCITKRGGAYTVRQRPAPAGGAAHEEWDIYDGETRIAGPFMSRAEAENIMRNMSPPQSARAQPQNLAPARVRRVRARRGGDPDRMAIASLELRRELGIITPKEEEQLRRLLNRNADTDEEEEAEEEEEEEEEAKTGKRKRGKGKEQDIEDRIRKLVESGMSKEQASKKAVSEFGKELKQEHQQEQKQALADAKTEVKEQKEEKEDEALKKAEVKGEQKVAKEEEYLAKEYAKEFPNQKLKGSALKKHMKNWVVNKLKALDCGCGCLGMKKLRELAGGHSGSAARRKLTLKYGERMKNRVLKGGKLVDCPAGYRNDGLTCLEECKPGETDTGLTCVQGCPNGYRDDGTACRKCPEGFTDTGAACLENCKSGETDLGLSCKSGCPSGYRDDGTYCRKCPPGYTDTGLSCYKGPGGGQCHGGEVRAKGSRYIAPYDMGWDGWRWRGMGGGYIEYDPCPSGWADDGLVCREPIHCDPVIPAETVGQDAFGNTRTKGSAEQMVIWKAVRGKDIKGRVDVNGTFEEIKAGIQKVLDENPMIAQLFDPEKNGVGAAFRKFGKDTEAAFTQVGNELLKAFDPNQNGVKAAFEKLGDAIKDTIGNENWWKETMSSPDTYIFLLGMIASAAATVLSAGTLGPAAFIALQALGPATKMIGDAAQGRPIDGMDIAGLVLGLVPIPGAGAAAKAASDAIIKGAAFGMTAAKALPYVQKAAQVGKLVVAGVELAQAAGYVPSTCLTNCPPPEKDEAEGKGECYMPCLEWDLAGQEGPEPEGCNCSDEAAKEELSDKLDAGDTEGNQCGMKCAEALLEDLPPPEGCDCDNVEEEDEDVALGEEGAEVDFGDFGLEDDEEEKFLDLEDFEDDELAQAAEEVGLDEADLEALDVDEEVERAQDEELESGVEPEVELDVDELNELEEAVGVEPEGEEGPTNAMLGADTGAELPEGVTPCQAKFYHIYGIDADEFLELDHSEMEVIAEEAGKTHEQAMDAAQKALRSGSGRHRNIYAWNKWS